MELEQKHGNTVPLKMCHPPFLISLAGLHLPRPLILPKYFLIAATQVLERLALLPDVFVAVISGRSVTNVKEMVGIEGITFAGNHGLDIIHLDGTKVTSISVICPEQL